MSGIVGSNIHLMRKCFEETLKELESEEKKLEAKEKKLNGFQESVTRSLEYIEKSWKDFQKKEAELKELQLVQENGFKELELKRKELAVNMEDFEIREQKLRDKEKLIKFEREEIEISQRDIKERYEEISRKEEALHKRSMELHELAEKFMASLGTDEVQAMESVLPSRKKQRALGENILELISQEVDGTSNSENYGGKESGNTKIGALQVGKSQDGRTKKRVRIGSGEMGESAKFSNSAITCHPIPQIFKFPAAEFYDFGKDKRKECFDVSQYWACYDSIDGMPRTYITILQVYLRGFKLRVIELVLDPEYKRTVAIRKGLPPGCGRFISQQSTIITDVGQFSHKIVSGIHRIGGAYLIYPSKGQIWALFKDWNSGSSNSKDPKKFSYEIVLVLSDFVESTGVRVAYLKKVMGYNGLFHRTKEDVSFVIRPDQMYRFSHQIPSYKMTGFEREGIPEGSLELDPAALPTHI